jgi:RHS repeat-associated protein
MSAPLWSGTLSWAYRLDGLPDWRSWPSGSAGAATYGYDGAKRPTTLTKAGTAAAAFSQTYDRDGNVTTEGRSLAGVSGDAGVGSQTFAYDGLSRVTGSSGLAATYGYGYDRDGNRTSATVGGTTTTYAYDRTGILRTRLDGGVTTYYAADGYGNLTSNAHAVNQVTTHAYDLADRLTAVTLPGGGNTTTAFTFDALGRIATRTGPGAPTETYGYRGTSDTVWQISDPSTTISSGLTPDGERVATGSGGLTGYLLADLHGNQGAVVNSAESAIVGATRYDPYGLTAASYSGSGNVPTPWRYQGRLDVSANPADPLYVAGARDYLPATGTFISLDSFPGAIGNPASLNRYLYGEANPTSLIDPSGHYAMEGEGTDGSGTWVAATSEIFWEQRATDLLTTYTTDQYDTFNWTTKDLLITQAGQQAWQWSTNPANNPYSNPFAVALGMDWLMQDDPYHYAARLEELRARLVDVPLEEQDAARLEHEEGNVWFYAFGLTSLVTGLGTGDDFGQRIGGSRTTGGQAVSGRLPSGSR